MSRRGCFIAVEGGDAGGKSTQVALLAVELGALATREPGGTALGEQLRGLVLGDGPEIVDRAETLMMLAARAQHVAEVIEPALSAGRHVVCDRFAGSTLAYQGHGRGLDVAELHGLSRWASRGLEPDLNVLLDVDDRVAAERRRGASDRLEAAGADFHRRVKDGFLSLASSSGDRWVVVDAAGSVDEVAARIASAVRSRIGPLVTPS